MASHAPSTSRLRAAKASLSTGTVYVGPPDADGVWKVSWQGPGSRFDSAWGSEEAVVAWALAQPASKRLICHDASGQELIWTDLSG